MQSTAQRRNGHGTGSAKAQMQKQLGFRVALASRELGVSRSVTEWGHSRPSSGLGCLGEVFLGIHEESLSDLLLDLPRSLGMPTGSLR